MHLIELHEVSIEILGLAELFMQCLENGYFNAYYRIFKFSTFGIRVSVKRCNKVKTV